MDLPKNLLHYVKNPLRAEGEGEEKRDSAGDIREQDFYVMNKSPENLTLTLFAESMKTQ